MLDTVKTITIFQKQPDPKIFIANQVIFEEGEPGDYMYGVQEGKVDLSVNGKVVEIIQPGDVFLYMCTSRYQKQNLYSYSPNQL